MGFEPMILRSRVYGGETTPSDDLLVDLLTHYDGTPLRTIAFTIYKTGE